MLTHGEVELKKCRQCQGKGHYRSRGWLPGESKSGCGYEIIVDCECVEVKDGKEDSKAKEC